MPKPPKRSAATMASDAKSKSKSKNSTSSSSKKRRIEAPDSTLAESGELSAAAVGPVASTSRLPSSKVGAEVGLLAQAGSKIGAPSSQAKLSRSSRISPPPSAKSKGKGKATEPESGDVESDDDDLIIVDTSAAAGKQQGGQKEPKDNLELVLERDVDEPSDLVVSFLEEEIRPRISAALETDNEPLELLSLWRISQKLEFLRNPTHWRLVTEPDGLQRLVKNGAWSSPSYHTCYFKITLVEISGNSYRITYDGVVFIFLLLTSEKWRPVFRKAKAAEKEGKLANFRATFEDLALLDSLRDCKRKCVYLLSDLLEDYVGKTLRTGLIRHDEHELGGASDLLIAARKKLNWSEWRTTAIYMPPVDLNSAFLDALLLLIEHWGINLFDSVNNGLNTLAFDKKSWEEKITYAELENFVVAVLDLVCPKNKDGKRIKVGTEVIEPSFFDRHYQQLNAIANLTPPSMVQLFVGGLREYHVRQLIKRHGIDDKVFLSGNRPVRLRETKEERAAGREARASAATLEGELEGWKAGRDFAKTVEKSFPNRELYPTRKRRIEQLEEAGEDANDVGEMELSWNRRKPDRQRVMENRDVDFLLTYDFGSGDTSSSSDESSSSDSSEDPPRKRKRTSKPAQKRTKKAAPKGGKKARK